MNFIFDKEKLRDMHQVISLFQKFDKYKFCLDRESLYFDLLPSFQLDQYKIHKHGDDVIAFNNWAFLNKEAENYYTITGEIKPEAWNSGDKVWHVDFICVKDVRKVMKWTKNYFTNLIGYNQPVNYLRIAEDGTITRKSKKLTHGQS
tara:strand:- start:229 stop:669 length:441 start_codon:yes stop_codon:yes gene_type:complete